MGEIEPNTPHIYNVAIVNPDTEYTLEIPEATKKIKIYAVDSNRQNVHGDCLKIAFKTSADQFIVVPPASSWEEVDLNLRQKTLYLQSPTGSCYAVVICWT